MLKKAILLKNLHKMDIDDQGNGIWIVKAEDIISSESNDKEAFFDPSNDKIYRHPTFYKIPDGIKHI